jgi:4-amino-4-deoxy-L-arabinose transferase-like glycosyltransferase
VGVVAIVVLVAARLSRRARARLVTVGLAGGVAAMIAAPGAWAASVLDTTYGGSSFNASAGPAGGFGGGGAGGGGAPTGGLAAAATGRYSGRGTAGGDRAGNPGGDRTTTGFPAGAGAGAGAAGGGGGGGGGITASATTTLTSAEQQLYNYVSAHRDGAGYLLAVGSWEEAGQYILATGQEVMDMGGFSGSVPSPTLAQVKNLVSTGQLKFFLISGSGGGAGFGAGGGGSTATAIDSWVSSACTEVPAKDYTSGTAAASTGTLYACGRDA